MQINESYQVCFNAVLVSIGDSRGNLILSNLENTDSEVYNNRLLSSLK